MPKTKRIISTSVLPGEPLDGSGRACIHLFVRDESGPFTEPHVLHPVMKDGVPVKQQVVAGPARGRLACDPRRLVTPVTTRSGVTIITMRTDDPRAATCLKCLASTAYAEMMRIHQGATAQ